MKIQDVITNALLGATNQNLVAVLERGDLEFTCQGNLTLENNTAKIVLSDFDNAMQETAFQEMKLEFDLNSDALKISMFHDSTEDEDGFTFITKEMSLEIVLTK